MPLKEIKSVLKEYKQLSRITHSNGIYTTGKTRLIYHRETGKLTVTVYGRPAGIDISAALTHQGKSINLHNIQAFICAI